MNSSRRDFFKNLVGMVGAGALFPTLLSSVSRAAEEKRRGKPGEGAAAGAGGDANLPLVQPGVGMAASLNYVHNNKDIKDAKLKTERQGVKFEQQRCQGCMLYTKVGMKNGEEVGKCQLFANQLVKSSGWCTSWTKKA